MLKKIIIARHQGFCMGVKRAIRIAEETADQNLGRRPVTILKEIVHNEAVVEHFRCKGVGQEYRVEDVDSGALIISAHGVSPDVVRTARSRGLTVIDATCPLVSRIYRTITDAIDQGYHIIHFGDPDHDETAGIVGHAPDRITVAATIDELNALPDWPDRKLGMTVQTTAHTSLFEEVADAAENKWPGIRMFNTICNATTQRQQAIVEMASMVDIILVVGSMSSANTNRLVKLSRDTCGDGRLIQNKDEIDPGWFDNGVEAVGVSAGASTPQFLVDEVIERLVELSGGGAEVERPGRSTQDEDE